MRHIKWMENLIQEGDSVVQEVYLVWESDQPCDNSHACDRYDALQRAVQPRKEEMCNGGQ